MTSNQPFRRGNCSAIPWGGRYLLAVRDGFVPSRIVLADLELANPPVARNERPLQIPLELKPGDAIADPRLFTFGGRLWCAYTYEKSFYRRAMQALCEIKPDGRCLNNTVFDGPAKPHDKNWQFFDHDGELLFVYAMSPEHVVVDLQSRVRGKTPGFAWPWGTPRASAPPVRVGDRYVTFYHSYQGKIWNDRCYKVGFYTFAAEPPFPILEHSLLPLLEPDPEHRPKGVHHCQVVFPSGCLRDGGDWLMFYGYFDYWSYVLRLKDLREPRNAKTQGDRIVWADVERDPSSKTSTVQDTPAAGSEAETIPAPREGQPESDPAVPRATICVMTGAGNSSAFRCCLLSLLRHTPLDQVEIRLGINGAAESFRDTLNILGGRDHLQDSRPGQMDRLSFYADDGALVRLWNAPVALPPDRLRTLLQSDVPLQGQYLVSLSDDALVEPDWWSKLCGAFDQGFDYLGRPQWAYFSGGEIDWIRRQSWFRQIPLEKKDGIPGTVYMSGFVAVRTAFLDGSGGGAGDPSGWNVLLGAMARQLGWRQASHDSGIRIPAPLSEPHPAG
jgi:hypothetical protein